VKARIVRWFPVLTAHPIRLYVLTYVCAKQMTLTQRCLCTLINLPAVATSRAFRAIFENNQESTGSVRIPTVLQPYMYDTEYL
jgi:hypothetical protein